MVREKYVPCFFFRSKLLTNALWTILSDSDSDIDLEGWYQQLNDNVKIHRISPVVYFTETIIDYLLTDSLSISEFHQCLNALIIWIRILYKSDSVPVIISKFRKGLLHHGYYTYANEVRNNVYGNGLISKNTYSELRTKQSLTHQSKVASSGNKIISTTIVKQLFFECFSSNTIYDNWIVMQLLTGARVSEVYFGSITFGHDFSLTDDTNYPYGTNLKSNVLKLGPVSGVRESNFNNPFLYEENFYSEGVFRFTTMVENIKVFSESLATKYTSHIIKVPAVNVYDRAINRLLSKLIFLPFKLTTHCLRSIYAQSVVMWICKNNGFPVTYFDNIPKKEASDLVSLVLNHTSSISSQYYLHLNMKDDEPYQGSPTQPGPVMMDPGIFQRILNRIYNYKLRFNNGLNTLSNRNLLDLNPGFSLPLPVSEAPEIIPEEKKDVLLQEEPDLIPDVDAPIEVKEDRVVTRPEIPIRRRLYWLNQANIVPGRRPIVTPKRYDPTVYMTQRQVSRMQRPLRKRTK